ncbi:MAG: DMT family transporter [Lentisphaeria bacterium]|nr:DMT family transporter [Lentisphaeria bacterium]
MINYNRLKGIIFGLTASAVWGSFYPVSRLIFGNELEKYDELYISALRVALSFIVMTPFLWIGNSRKVLKSNWKKDIPWFILLALSCLGEAVLVFISTKYTTAARASLMANTAPIFTAIIAFFMVREALNRSKIAGMILGFLGITLAVLSNGSDTFTGGCSTLYGDLLALGSGVCWAFFTVAGEKVANRYGGMFSTAVTAGIGTIFIFLIVFLSGAQIRFDFSWKAWLGLLYLGGGVNGLNIGLWYMALKYLRPGELGGFGYITALLAIALSVIFVNERFSWSFILAIPLVLCGIYLMLRKSSKDV